MECHSFCAMGLHVPSLSRRNLTNILRHVGEGAKQAKAPHTLTLPAPPPHILRHIGDGVEHSVHGIDVRELHELAVRELAALVKLAAAVACLKDVEGRHLGEGRGGRRLSSNLPRR